jgi:hypothetical protein
MQFTFGIITDGNYPSKINDFIKSVENNNIPQENYEIIIVGGKEIFGTNIKHIAFNESTKKSWITKKKNLITQNAKFNNIVYLHDYIILDKDWYLGFLKFGDNWDVCMNKIINQNGERFRDWVMFPDFVKNTPLDFGRDLLLPYDISHLTKYQYISGTYWVAKKEIMQKYPLDESLSWGQGEDVKWSKELIKNKVKYVMNQFSTVIINKEYKAPTFNIMNDAQIKIAENFND